VPEFDSAGQGASRFRAYLRSLPDDIALARENGLPVVLEVADPLPPHAQRLMDTLGVEVRIVSPIAHRESRELVARTEGNYVLPGVSDASGNGHGPRTDWIDYRASIARVHKREQNGDEALTCPGCGTETDVTDVVHSPKCKTLARPPEKASESDRDSVIAALRANAKDGVAPAGSDWYTKAEGRPTYAIVQRVFGSWADGVEAAGLERAQRGRKAQRSSIDSVGGAEVGNREGDDEPQVSAQVATSSSADGEETASAGQDGSETSERVRVGAPSSKPRKWTRDAIEAAVRRWAELHGERPKSTDWLKPTGGEWPQASAVQREFGSWNACMTACGFDVSKPVRTVVQRSARGAKWTREQLIERLQDWAAAHDGNAPTSYDWRLATDEWPTTDNVMKLFGSWRAGVEAAGLRIRRRSPEELGHQEPPVVWAVKVPGTGLRYRTVDEALVAADEIEHDGERVARQARVDGQEGKADQAIDASRELAEKIRAACNLHAETIQAGSETPVVEPVERAGQNAESIPAASEEREGTAPETSRSSDAEIVVAAVRELDPLTLTGEQTAGWIARLEAESERLHRRAEAFDTIAEGLRLLQETER
jgi:hypothetical protein